MQTSIRASLHSRECDRTHAIMLAALKRLEWAQSSRPDDPDEMSEAARERATTLRAFHRACRDCPECR